MLPAISKYNNSATIGPCAVQHMPGYKCCEVEWLLNIDVWSKIKKRYKRKNKVTQAYLPLKSYMFSAKKQTNKVHSLWSDFLVYFSECECMFVYGAQLISCGSVELWKVIKREEGERDTREGVLSVSDVHLTVVINCVSSQQLLRTLWGSLAEAL